MTQSASLSLFTSGVDVSAAQAFAIDWAAVRNANKRFAYVKANTAEGPRDPWFTRHARDARAAGLLVGAYHFALVDNDPADDFEAFVVAIDKADLELPPALDIETRNGADALRVLMFVDGWLNECARRGYGTPVIYTGPGFWRALGKPAEDERYGGFPLWQSQYGVTTPSPLPPWGHRWSIWQSHGNTIAKLLVPWTDPATKKAYDAGAQVWGDTALRALAVQPRIASLLAKGGTCQGIRGEVDLDVFAGSYDDLRRWANLPVAELTNLSDDARVRA